MGIGALVVIFFILVSNILDVGEKLRNIHEYVEYSFYGLSAILVYFLFINPIRIIIFSPTFTVDAMLSNDNKRHRIYKDAARVLIKSENITDEDKELLKKSLSSSKELGNSLQTVFTTSIRGNINECITRNSKSVLITTALSQNGNLDMLSSLIVKNDKRDCRAIWIQTKLSILG